MKITEALRVGISFGLTSAAITTMGLMVGLYTGTQSLKTIIAGVLMIAIADAFSDALGMHIHEESENEHTPREIWASTFATFGSKFVFAASFLVPIFIFDLETAVLVSVGWGITLVALISYMIARQQRVAAGKIIAEHLVIAVAVIAITALAGRWISGFVQ